jgi:hypothetical protein
MRYAGRLIPVSKDKGWQQALQWQNMAMRSTTDTSPNLHK